MVLVGRIAGAVVTIFGLIWIPVIPLFGDHLWIYLQSIQVNLTLKFHHLNKLLTFFRLIFLHLFQLFFCLEFFGKEERILLQY